MIVPAVYVFQGLDGMGQGAGLMFVSLPQVFQSMGAIGDVVAILFFIMVLFAALTSSVSIMEVIVAAGMAKFNKSRKAVSITVFAIFVALSVIICLGYNVLYFEADLPNGKSGQQLLDVVDYISNNLLMPVISFLTCILIGWVVGTKWIKEEVKLGAGKFSREGLYNVMIKFVAPALMVIILATALGVDRVIVGWFK